MTVSVRLVVVAVVACACRREPERARPPRRPRDMPATNVSLRPMPAPDAATPCSSLWPDETALTFEAPSPNAPFELDAVCSSVQLSVAWRVGASASVASRLLRPDAPWGPVRPFADDVATLGRPMAAATAVWLAWTTPLGALRSARVDDSVMRSADAVPGRNAYFRDAHVIYVKDAQALVASTYRDHATDRVLVHRVGVGSAPPAGALVGDGLVAATLPGAHPIVVTATRVPRTPGGPWLLRAHRLDAPVAMAVAAPSTPGVFGTLAEGGDAAGEALPVGVGRFEFVPSLAQSSAAMLFETVIGAERGAVRVAWFPSVGPPAMVTLPTAATGLAAVFDAPSSSDAAPVTIVYWDDRHTPRRANVTPAGIGAPERIGEALEGERAVHEVARRTRWLICDGARWRVEARVDGAVAHVFARRADCASP